MEAAIAENMALVSLPHTAKHLSNGLWSKSGGRHSFCRRSGPSQLLSLVPAGQNLAG